MTLDYVRLPVVILKIKDLTFAQKIILGLVASLSKGLKLSNSSLGEILGVSEGHVSRMINDLEKKGYVEIKNRQSKYRQIYLGTERKVEGVVLQHGAQSKDGLLCALARSTSAQSANITEGTKDKGTMGIVTDVEIMQFWNSHRALPRIISFTPQRKKALAARNKEPLFRENWRSVIEKLARSSFHTGENDRGWRADVGWILKPGNYVKILELPEDDCAVGTREVSEKEAAELMRTEVVA